MTDPNSQQIELPGMPASQAPSEEAKLAAEIKSYKEAFAEHGVLVSPVVGGKLLKVSTQRVCQLLDAGKLTRFVFFGQNWIPLAQLQHRLSSPKETGATPHPNRKGRPRKVA